MGSHHIKKCASVLDLDVPDCSSDGGHSQSSKPPERPLSTAYMSGEGVYVTLKDVDRGKQKPNGFLEIDDTEYARAKRQVTRRLNQSY